ncbi:flap endonuclease-1 [Candidatus Woesearchaeota archaeon]|nr:flap endonuclease-1 [Candidatus Woesearchaeota archaeon]
MGINIWELLPKKEIEISDLKGKVLAVDASPAIYQFLASIRQRNGIPLMDSKGRITSHLMGISTRVTKLMAEGLKLIFCFDGRAPDLKIYERERREHRKRVAEEKLKQAQQEEDTEAMLKYSKQTIRLSDEIISQSKELLKALGIPVIQAVSEAEAQCAYIVKQKDAWAVVSQDADALLFGTPRLIRSLTISQRRRLPSGGTIQNKPELIDLKQTLNQLKINQDQLIVLGILIGTDYNVGGVRRIGPKIGLKLVQQQSNFDKLFQEVKPDFNWKQIYAIFKSMPVMENYQLNWKEPDQEKVKKILVDKHDFSEERVNKTLQQITKKPISQKGLDSWVK